MPPIDTLLIVSIVALLLVTVLNQGSRYGSDISQYMKPSRCLNYNPMRYSPRSDSYCESADVDEIQNHPRSRGIIPRKEQPQHTKNLWKPEPTQPDYDYIGRRESDYSSDLRATFKNQNKLLSVKPDYEILKTKPIGKSYLGNC